MTKARKGKRSKAFWNYRTVESTRQLREAERSHRRHGTELSADALRAARAAQKATLIRESTRSWRETTAEATRNPKLLWSLAAWGKNKSHVGTERAHMPDLERGDGQAPATLMADKADALAERFFPDTRPGEEPSPGPSQGWIRTQLPAVMKEDVEEAISRPSPWKAPGCDGIANGFLRCCGAPLIQAIKTLTTASLALGHYPKAFKLARVVVLRKPGKTTAQLKNAGGWRPISLLSCVGKVVEAIIAAKITQMAEESGVLPPEQMGNRAGRSTELAARFVVETVRASWEKRLNCSMLQLDLKGAFDNVHHRWLIETLKDQGWPRWVTNWTRSYLQDRKAILSFDDWESTTYNVQAGVPQGSPLSPLLFILFLAPLFDELRKINGVATVGFADDTNLVAVGKQSEDCCQALEKGWQVCDTWAKRRGMTFEPAKSVLTHFTRGRKPVKCGLRLGEQTVEPVEETRFLGVYLDRRLSFKAHQRHVLSRMKTQRFALSGIAAMTWGPSLLQARQVYVAVIRSLLTYAASTFATPDNALGGKKGRGKGIVSRFETEQNKCLRTVTGAYRSTPIKALEVEANCAPIGIELAKRAAAFELKMLGGTAWPDAWGRIKRLVASARRYKRRKLDDGPSDPMQRWWSWRNASATDAPDTAKERAEQEWAELREREGTNDLRPRVGLDWESAKKIWAGLTKAESSCLVQIRTGHIGLNQYLSKRNVPGIEPWCSCNTAQETIAHVILDCKDQDRSLLPPLRGRRDLYDALESPETCKKVVRWMLATGRLKSFELAQKLQRDQTDTGQ